MFSQVYLLATCFSILHFNIILLSLSKRLHVFPVCRMRSTRNSHLHIRNSTIPPTADDVEIIEALPSIVICVSSDTLALQPKVLRILFARTPSFTPTPQGSASCVEIHAGAPIYPLLQTSIGMTQCTLRRVRSSVLARHDRRGATRVKHWPPYTCTG